MLYEIKVNEGRELHLKNWETNYHSDSLFQYACSLSAGFGGSRDVYTARNLFKENWEKNRNIKSLGICT